ncbi:MAG: MBL fold metallo-hydrolase [Acidimicrobiales bacterium]
MPASTSPSSDTAETPRPIREERRDALTTIDEVAPGVLRIQLPISLPGLGHVNCYAIPDSRGVALVDPGLPGPKTKRVLKQRLAEAGFKPRDVHTVVVTHSHPDHFGQAGYFGRLGAKVITHESFRTWLDPASEADDETIDVAVTPTDAHLEAIARHEANDETERTAWGGEPHSLPWRRKLAYKAMRKAGGRLMPLPKPTDRVVDADVLSLGDTEWVSVHTPGHTPDHLCLWSPTTGAFISGDHVLPTITPHISGNSDAIDPLANFFESLERMSEIEGVTTVLPAHGLAFEALGDRAQAIKRHHEERLDILRAASAELGNGTVAQYMEHLFQPRSWGHMAESETYAHLEHLRLLGEAKVDYSGRLLKYSIG